MCLYYIHIQNTRRVYHTQNHKKRQINPSSIHQGLHYPTMELEKAIRGSIPAPMTVGQVASALGASITPLDNSTTTLGGRNCPHGKMTAIQGTGKDGSMYRGYFCPAPKGAFDKCKNVYLKTTDAAWNTFVPEQVK